MSDTRSERNRWERVREWLVDVYDPVMAREPRRTLSEQSMMLAEQSEAAAYREVMEMLEPYNLAKLHRWPCGGGGDAIGHLIERPCTCGLTAVLDELKGQSNGE